MVEENDLAPTPTNCTDPHSLRRTRFTLVLRKAIFPPAMVLRTYTAKSTTLRGKHSNKLYLPVYHIQIPWPMPLIVMLLKTVKKWPTTFRKHRNSNRTFRHNTTMYRVSHRLTSRQWARFLLFLSRTTVLLEKPRQLKSKRNWYLKSNFWDPCIISYTSPTTFNASC